MESEKSFKHTPSINLKTDFSDHSSSNMSMSIDNYTHWNVQNFTELINKPKVIIFINN